jgi:hypothetical protein
VKISIPTRVGISRSRLKIPISFQNTGLHNQKNEIASSTAGHLRSLVVDIVSTKLKAVGILIFLRKEVESNIFASDILYSRILISNSRKYSEKSKVSDLSQSFVRFD